MKIYPFHLLLWYIVHFSATETHTLVLRTSAWRLSVDMAKKVKQREAAQIHTTAVLWDVRVHDDKLR